MSTTSTGVADAARFGSGHAVRRIEDPALVSGAGKFTDDTSVAGELHLCFLRSPHAHATIRSIDTDDAKAAPGVAAIFTQADLAAAGVHPLPVSAGFKRPGGEAGASPERHALAKGVVRFVGEAVAAVLADTRQHAREACDLIAVDYEDLPSVSEVSAAAQPGAVQVWPAATGNIAAQARHGDRAKAQALFEQAAHVVSLHLVNQRLVAAPMEPRSVRADWDKTTGRLTVGLSSQMPAGVRNTLCDEVLKIPKEQVRVTVGDVGGGFGMKTGLYPEDAVVAWSALKLQRSVRWTAERGEEFTAASHGRDVVSDASLALDANGKVLALRVQSLANVGAYATGTGVAIQLLIGPWVATSIYDIPVIDFELTAILTHTSPTGAYRGAGRPEAIYIIERLMDAAAQELGVDPADLRRRSMIRPEQMPFKNPMGQVYDSGQFEKITQQALVQADWAGFESRRAASQARGKLRGRGIASFLEWTGGNVFEERVTVQVSGDGYIEIFSATQAMGQGIATTYAQLAVDIFNVPIEKIRIVQGDTDRGVGFGSAGSRSLFTGGTAVKVASQQTVDKARDLAADSLEAAVQDIEYRAGTFRVVGTDRAVDLFELAGKQPGGSVWIDATSTVAGPSWPNGCHICEVEIAEDTGEVQVVAYSSVNDVGRVVNPLIVRGQLDGGAIQGIGQALTEEVRYDADSGQLLTGSFMDYAMPRADMVALFKTSMDESIPCLTNPLGAKGVGELGTIGATPAVVNAVVDALARIGLGEAARSLQMPVTAEKVWRVLRTGKEARA